MKRLHAAGLLVTLIWLLSCPVLGQSLTSAYFEKVHSGQPLKVALAQETPPFCLRDASGTPHGLDVAIAQKLGQVLGVDVTFVYPPWEEQIQWLQDGRSDLIIANLTITMDRARQIAFSPSYLDFTQGVLLDRRYIPRDIVEGKVVDVKVNSFDDLQEIPGLVVGTWSNTTSSDWLTRFHPQMERRSYDSVLSAREALKRGEINALVADSPIIEFLYATYPGDRKRFKPLTKPVTDERLGIGLRMGDPDFAAFLAVFVDELRADGTLDVLLGQYLESTEWAQEVLR